MKYLYIDSKDASGGFRINLSTAENYLSGCQEVALHSVSMLHNFYNVTTDTTINFSEPSGGGGTGASFVIPAGNYTYSEITALMKAGLDANSPNTQTYSFSVNLPTNIVTLNSTGSFRLNSSLVSTRLGFGPNDRDSDGGNNVVGVEPLDLLSPKVVYLSASMISDSHRYIENNGASNELLTSTISRIPITVSYGSLLNYESNTLQWHQITSHVATSLIFKLFDEENNELSLGTYPMSITLAYR